jgi:hypothetical protein
VSGLGRLALALAVLGWATAVGLPHAFSQETSKETAETPAREPIERRPYRISVHLSCDKSARIDAAGREDLLSDWQILVRRLIGAPWVLTIAPATSPLANLDPEGLDGEAFASYSSFDKVWVVRVSRSESEGAIQFEGREYDTASRRLGPFQRRIAQTRSDTPRTLLQFSQDLFNPTAEIASQERGHAVLKVQGAALTPASPAGAVVSRGTVFLPLRLVSLNDGKLQILRIPYTYLLVESVEGPVAHCNVISAMSDPLTRRMLRPNSLAALGVKAGSSAVALRFVTKPSGAPAAGYTLTARLVPDGQPHAVGTTDRAGRIVLQPGFADGLVILRLLAGDVEPMVELPMMPGVAFQEKDIAIDPKPETVALESRIESLRDEVVDLVALRARLEARMKARLDGENWTKLEEALQEFAKLTPPETYAQRLADLKKNAAEQQTKDRKAVLTRTALAQINDLQSMIDRYLDDEMYKAYADALERAKAQADAVAQAAAKKAAARTAAQNAARAAQAKGKVPAGGPGQTKGAPAQPKGAPPKRPPPKAPAQPF